MLPKMGKDMTFDPALMAIIGAATRSVKRGFCHCLKPIFQPRMSSIIPMKPAMSVAVRMANRGVIDVLVSKTKMRIAI